MRKFTTKKMLIKMACKSKLHESNVIHSNNGLHIYINNKLLLILLWYQPL